MAIRDLLTLLREQDLLAHERFRELAGALASVLTPQSFVRLRDAVESYRFADAATLLEERGAAA